MTEEVNWDGSGLAAAVVQHAFTAEVLMLGWMNPRALERTRETGRVTFWSRSREQLWEKGETSGNWLELVEIRADCDGDALLIEAIPHGPTCHTGTDTCWGDSRRAGFASLDRLWDVVIDRAATRPLESYTTELLEKGPEGPGRKLVEEATEVLLAAKDHAAGTADDRRLAEEAGDLIYHLLVTLAERGVAPSEVFAVLEDRRR
jgi:phosphoribosyl-ATP pyrophosphohydrolase/phosphoribosyl-AMP cyclohydrolase